MTDRSRLADGVVPAVAMRGIVKRFGDLVANAGIDLTLEPGTIHALLGENGAGKTTLMKVLYGLTQPDEGEIRVAGEPVRIGSPREAIDHGIGMVTQHFSLVAPMTVTENVMLGANPGIRLDTEAAAQRVARVSAGVGLFVEPRATIASLSVGERQRVEIVKALYRDCRVLILDEPTAVLTPQEVGALFEVLRRLRGEGLAIVFISHKLREVRTISDVVTVLRLGEVVGEARTDDVDERELARMMVGRPTIGIGERPAVDVGAPILEVAGLSALRDDGVTALRDTTFEVGAGEILGVAGVSGNGQTELAEVLSGMRQPTAGRVTVDGVDVTGLDPAGVMRAGVGRIPEDREASVIGDLSVAYNLAIEHLTAYRRGWQLDEDRIRSDAEQLIERFQIKARPGDRIASLSGGNRQKVLLARVLARDPRLLVVAQPTRGLDVGATEYVHRQLLAARERGAGLLVMSEDLEEVLTLADRVMVLYEGRIVGTFAAEDADVEHLGLLMAGAA